MLPVAVKSVANMTGKSSQSHSRPSLSSQQSSSVPSTPHQRARRDFTTTSRSPSPRGLSGNHSPRSVFSESNSTLSSLPKGRPTCRYEGVLRLTSKRRMQYDIGDAHLDEPTVTPKESLDPEEDKKLTADMRELYDRLLPTEDSEERRRKFLQKLEHILHDQWPGNEFTVHVFGSSGNMLCTSDSDVDICIQTPMKELESMHQLAAALDHHGMEKVACVPAKVPIVKIWDPELKLSADLNVNNTLALENTRMIKTYVQIDERVRPLVMIIKHWTKQRLLNDAGIGGTLSSYAWICMIINFLQTRKPKILPSLHQRSHKAYIANDGSESGFDDDLEKLHKYGAANKLSLGQLLFQFFRYYGYDFKYEKSVVSVRSGKLLTREEKGWQTGGKDGQWRLCVEEPFNSTRNLGNSADATAFRGIHLELRAAFTHLCNLDLSKVMEKYEFPPEEKHIFKRPQASKVVLSASTNRKPFGGGSMRSNRNNGGRGNHSGASSRRSSTGTGLLGRNNLSPYLTSPMLPPDFMTDPHGFNQWQQWQMMVHQQQNQVQTMATAHAHSVLQSNTPVSQSRDSSNASHQNARAYSLANGTNGLVNGAHFYPNYPYGMTVEQSQQMVQSLSHEGSRTNPSSPSLGSSVPARRGLQRTSVSNGSTGASTRSQSQPARQQQSHPQQNIMPPFPSGYDASGLPLYPVSSPGDALHGYRTPDNQIRFGAMPVPNLATEDRPKEYLGFSRGVVENRNNASAASQSGDSKFSRIQSQPDLSYPKTNGQSDLKPLVVGNNKNVRSTSPGHSRHMSTPLRSAPLPSIPRFGQIPNAQEVNQSPSYPTLPTQPPTSNGLLIVNGSTYLPSSTHEASRLYAVSTPDETASTFFGSTDSPASQYTPGQNNSEYYPTYDMDVLASRFSPGMMLDSPSNAAAYTPDQSFPPYVDPSYSSTAVSNGLDEQSVMSPTTMQQSPFQTFHGTSSTSSSVKDGQDSSKSPQLKSAPVLSPVMENRIPTPMVVRKPENVRLPSMNGNITNGSLVNGRSFNEVLSKRLPEPTPPTPLTMAAPSGAHKAARVSPNQRNAPAISSTNATNANSWQTNEPKKKQTRKRAKSGPVRSNDASTSNRGGQPLPAKPEDRKGG